MYKFCLEIKNTVRENLSSNDEYDNDPIVLNLKNILNPDANKNEILKDRRTELDDEFQELINTPPKIYKRFTKEPKKT